MHSETKCRQHCVVVRWRSAAKIDARNPVDYLQAASGPRPAASWDYISKEYCTLGSLADGGKIYTRAALPRESASAWTRDSLAMGRDRATESLRWSGDSRVSPSIRPEHISRPPQHQTVGKSSQVRLCRTTLGSIARFLCTWPAKLKRGTSEDAFCRPTEAACLTANRSFL